MSYTITTELCCDGCGEHSSNHYAAFYSGTRAQKRKAIHLGKKKGWYVYGNGERMLCPECRKDEGL